MKYSMTIDGSSVSTSKYEDIKNPATNDVVGQCPIATKDQLNDAVAAARTAFPAWAATPDKERQAACFAVAKALEEHAEELAKLLTEEQGKPLNGVGSRFELGGCAAWANYTASLELPVEVLQDGEAGRIEMHRKPVGVVGSILPWNWPLLIGIWHALPAIRMGNTIVMKPSPNTPLSTLRMVEIMSEVLPKGVINVVTGTNELGVWITEHEDINKISFTGSTPTGKKIMSTASKTLKRVTLELGGNDAGIVLPDVDPAAIAEGLFWGGFINNGQTCAALKRLYVHDDVYDAVCEELTKFAAAMPMGNGLDEQNIIGPVQNEMQYKIVSELVDEAVAAGAKVILGGNPEGGTLFYPTTLLANVTDDMSVAYKEQFGPVLPILRYSDIDDVIARANNSDNGLGGSVWSKDTKKAGEIASRLECGSVWINSHGTIQPNVPFGGVKGSGLGTMFGIEGLKELTTIQCIFGL